VSRRGGVVKEPLSRDRIVAVALASLEQDGLAGMSLRKIAQALETGPASLYAYVENLEELQALVLDKALAEVKTKPSREQDVRARLTAVLGSHLSVLLSKPGLAQLAMTTIAVGPNGLRIVEALLGILEDAGVDAATAAWAVDLLTLYTTAIAAEQSHRQAQEHADGADTLAPVARAIAAVSADTHPRIVAARDHLVSGTGQGRGAWAIEVLLSGILHTPRVPEPATAPASTRSKRLKPRPDGRG
jgi:AcrR family transcriptional regulator